MGLHVSASGEDFVEWAWNSVEGAGSYDVQFSLNDVYTSEDEIVPRTAAELSYRREGLAAGIRAFLRVRSASGSGENRLTSDWSTSVTGVTLEPPPPPEPPAQVTGVTVAEVGESFVRWTWDPVEGATGYEAAPYLAADPERERNVYFVEEPSVRVDGFEPDTALWIHVRAVRETAGGRAVGEWSNRVFVETWGERRECSDERAQALAYGSIPPVLIEEWDGTPFQFYWDEAIPVSERADAEHFFDVVERLSDRIEEQIGYSILEVEGWIQEADRGFRIGRTDVRDCDGVRPGGIVATVIPELVPVRNLVIARARPACAVMYWTRNDIDTTLDGVMAHELFHLFGFTHSPESTHPNQTPPGVGYPMTVHLTNQYTNPRELGPAFRDVDALRCIFPRDGRGPGTKRPE